MREGDWDYSPATGLPEEITVEFEADVICKNGEEITVSLTLHYDGSELDELQDASDQDYEGAIGSIHADAEGQGARGCGHGMRALRSHAAANQLSEAC